MSKTKMVEDWMPSQETLIKMMRLYPEVDIQYDKEKFVD